MLRASWKVVSSVVLGYWLTAGLPTPAFAQDIRVGVVQDQSGLSSDVSRDYLAGARTYFDHTNSQGGLRGRKINLVVRDDGGDPQATVRLTNELISSERVEILFGFTGDESVEALIKDSRFRASQIALFAPLSGADASAARDAIFYLRPSYREEARHLIKHFALLGVKEFAIANVDSAFGTQLRDQVKAELQASGSKLVAQQSFPLDLRGLDRLAQQMLSAQPKVIVVAADTISMAEFVKAFRRLDKGTTIVGLSMVNHRTLMEIAKPDFAASTLITQVVPNPLLEMTRVQSEHLALMKKYRDEVPSHLTLEGFLAAKALVRLLERTPNLSRANLLANLSTSSRIDLGGLSINFTPTQDRGSSYVDLAYLRRNGVLVQ